MDEVLRDLTRIDPDHYLAASAPGPISSAPGATGWFGSTRLLEREMWKSIACEYAVDIGSSSVVIGGSCALQGYAWRLGSLSIGRWARSGRGVHSDHERVAVRLRRGRTVGLHVEPADATDVETLGQLADGLHAHLAPIVEASRTVSRITPRVAWGNVAASLASAWRRVHDAVPEAHREQVRDLAEEFLQSDPWPWTRPPIEFSTTRAAHGASLTHRRSTCCLMRLAPEKGECTPCSELSSDEIARRWADAPSTLTAPPPWSGATHVCC